MQAVKVTMLQVKQDWYALIYIRRNTEHTS